MRHLKINESFYLKKKKAIRRTIGRSKKYLQDPEQKKYLSEEAFFFDDPFSTKMPDWQKASEKMEINPLSY